MTASQQLENEILEAVIFLRTENHSIPSETIEFMKQASLDKLNNHPDHEIKTHCFDCWDNKGNTYIKYIVALSVDDAQMIFKSKYPDLGYDEPYC